MSNPLKRWFEGVLWNSRFVVLIAVIVSLLSALALFCLVIVDFRGVLAGTLHAFEPDLASGTHDALLGDIVRKIITVVDAALLGAFMLIFGFGLYELFIGEIEIARSSKISRRLLEIESLEALKTRLGKVILIILIVEVFKDANRPETPPLNLLYLTIAIALIALALYLTHGGEAHKPAGTETPGHAGHREGDLE
ncbi:MAG: YqhA family protein [Verrucomicrobia bacterium]|nr:YqhA family protein [Verrucomicrobiota bacterium]